jgi:uncharacterized MAPEG superfamily protein
MVVSLEAAWIVAVLANSLKVLGLAQAIGILRFYSGSLASIEDHEALRATFGPPPETLTDSPRVKRLQAIHRNELESLPIFFAVSYAYILTVPPTLEVLFLFGLYTAARLAHTIFYAFGASPWRSIAWGVAIQTLLIMVGRCAAWLLPSAAITVQLAVNAPLALQWVLGCGMMMSWREQRDRLDVIMRHRASRGRPMADGGDDDEEALALNQR